MTLHLVAGKVTDSVTYGFLPAALGLGPEVVVLTDRPADHERAYEGVRGVEVVECAVTDFREIIGRIARIGRRPAAVFSNSDHLQAPTALAAAYFDLPGKDWRAATRAKNKALMRRCLERLDPVYAVEVPEAGDLAGDVPYPLVLKPREGVAGEDVFLVRDAAELAARRAQIRGRRADPLVAEEYLPGELHTLETLGDGRTLWRLGSFRTRLSPPPHFVEERLTWAPPPHGADPVVEGVVEPVVEPVEAVLAGVVERLGALGVGFGACHTEFVTYAGRPRLIEVNYRIVGDHTDFLLADLLGVPLFERVLRVHLGEPLAGPAPAPAAGHAVVDCVIADRSGELRAAPGFVRTADGDVRLTYRPVRSAGDAIEITRTNRDYLGTIEAIGPDEEAVEAAIARFRAAHAWEIG